jgi:O-antigen biosynthesis protein
VRVAFLLPSLQLSGGINVVVEHGTRLARDHGMDVTLVVTHHQGEPTWPYEGLGAVRVVDLDDVRGESFDLALATWWDTVANLADVPAKQYAYFVQSLEDRFYLPDDPQGALAGLTYRLRLPVVTEARWIAEVFERTDPELPCFYVRNGINKDVFPEAGQVEPRRDGPLRILIEGNPQDHIKGVPEALEAVRHMEAPAEVTVVAAKGGRVPGAEVVGPLSQRELSDRYARTDVVLKLSRVEGMSGPPLEGFHRGATCVCTPVTGHDEYLQHGWNGLLVGWDDIAGTARALDLVATDRRLLHFLRTNAATTAGAWPSWDQSATMMAGALRALLRAPAFDMAASDRLHREARHQVARAAHLRHELNVKLAAESAHIGRLESAWTGAEQAAAHRAERLREISDRLDAVGRSRWLRLVEVAERPIRRRRPGPTVRQQLLEARERADDA